jgi:hypothetical protein
MSRRDFASWYPKREKFSLFITIGRVGWPQPIARFLQEGRGPLGQRALPKNLLGKPKTF